MEPIGQRLRKTLPAGINPGRAPGDMTSSIVHLDPVKTWEHLLSAIFHEQTCALMNPRWPESWKKRLAAVIRDFPESKGPSILIPTSGSTRLPKFCIHTLDTLSCAAIGFAQRFGARGIIHSVNILPQHHVGGLMPVFRSAECGGKAHFADYQDSRSIEAAPFPLEEASLSIVPTQLGRMLGDNSRLKLLQRFGLILVGGAACPRDILHRAREEGLRLSPCYGSTETAAMVTAMDPEDFARGQCGVGTALPHARIRIDAEQRILIHAGSNLLDYLPAEEAFNRDPWQSGDLGSMDTNGNLSILGRADRVIITGGEKVHPELIESAAMDTGFVSAVRCLSQPDPDWGQRVSLMLVPSSKSFHEGRFRAALAQILPAYAMPKEINISDEIPVNSMGKPVDYVD